MAYMSWHLRRSLDTYVDGESTWQDTLDTHEDTLDTHEDNHHLRRCLKWTKYLPMFVVIFVDGVDIFIDTVTVCIGQCMPDVASAAACDATHNTSSPVPVRWQWLYDSKSDAPSSSALSSPALSIIASNS